MADELAKRGQSIPFSVVSNPEFLKEGAAVEDFMKPDRIIVGTAEGDQRAIELMQALYAPFQRSHDKLVFMDVRSAELTKYAANAMLATRISFMNELALLAEKLGADIEDVRRGIGSDPRIGYQFLYAGCGYGGSCFPKDVKALIHTGTYEYGQDLTGRHFALWGLAFKPNTDDMREAPSRVVIEALLAAGATLTAYDPVATEEAQRVLGHHNGLSFAASAAAALTNADALIIVTEWKEFRSPNFDLMAQQLKSKTVFDGRNLYDPKTVASHGLRYHGIGRA